jgi:hypothetical protein
LPASSPEVSKDEDDTTMETDSDDSAPAPAPPVHAGFTMEQAQVHYNAAMAEEQHAPAPMLAFHQALEERRYNMFLLEQHQLAEGRIDSGNASEEAVVAMAATNPNFVAKRRAIYEAVRAQAAARQEATAMEAQLQAITEVNNASCASYAPLTNYQAAQWDDDSAGATISIVDLTSISDRQGTAPLRMSRALGAAGPCVPCGPVHCYL